MTDAIDTQIDIAAIVNTSRTGCEPPLAR